MVCVKIVRIRYEYLTSYNYLVKKKKKTFKEHQQRMFT